MKPLAKASQAVPVFANQNPARLIWKKLKTHQQERKS